MLPLLYFLNINAIPIPIFYELLESILYTVRDNLGQSWCLNFQKAVFTRDCVAFYISKQLKVNIFLSN